MQGPNSKIEDMAAVVQHVKKELGIQYVYCWHALHAYWSGVSPAAAGTSAYGSQVTHPTPTPGGPKCPSIVCYHIWLYLPEAEHSCV